jgi:DNA-binding SARP family transcriptional activator
MRTRKRALERTSRQALRLVGAIVALDVVVVAPALLAGKAVWSLTEAPTWNDIAGTLIGEPVFGRAGLWKLIASAGWAVWALVATATAVEAAALLRGRPAPRFPGLARLQAVAAWMLGAAVLSTPSAAGQRDSPKRRPTDEESCDGWPSRRPARRASRPDAAQRRRRHTLLGQQHIVVRFGRLVPALTRRRAVSQPRHAEPRQDGTDVPPVHHPLPEPTPDLTERVEQALRRFGSVMKQHPSMPMPVVAAVHGGHVEVLLDRGVVEAPPPWNAQASGRIWRSPLGAAGGGLDPGPALRPWFVSLGALGEGGILLNLEAVGAVGVVGQPASAFALTRSVLLELARRRVAGAPVTYLVGDIDEVVPSTFEIVRHPDIAEALAAIGEAPASIADSLAKPEILGLSEPRYWEPSRSQPVIVVVAGVAATEDPDIERLVQRCRQGCGIVALFVIGRPAGALEIQVGSEETMIPAFGLRCRTRIEREPPGPARASEGGDPSAVATSGHDSAALGKLPTADEERRDGNESRCFLHLLGSITVEGVDVRPQQLAILAYLALHGETTADALRDAVWGGKPPTRARFLNTMHELRRVVGANVLPSARDGRYRLCHVWSDLAEVERLVASAATEPDTASADLRAVLELVSGPPVSYESRHRRHFRWVDLGNHASHWERIVCDAAHRLASIALQADDLDLARWAAERGLLACPGSETLTADLVRAHLAAGDRKTAERVVGEYSRSLEDAGDEAPPYGLHELLGSAPEA